MKRLVLLILLWGCAHGKPDRPFWRACVEGCSRAGAEAHAVVEDADSVSCVCKRAMLLAPPPAGT